MSVLFELNERIGIRLIKKALSLTLRSSGFGSARPVGERLYFEVNAVGTSGSGGDRALVQTS